MSKRRRAPPKFKQYNKIKDSSGFEYVVRKVGRLYYHLGFTSDGDFMFKHRINEVDRLCALEVEVV